MRSAVAQVLGTVGASDFTQGEMPWRTEFGSLLHLLRHQKNDVALREMAKVYVQDALRRWEPRIMVTRLDAERLDDNEAASSSCAFATTSSSATCRATKCCSRVSSRRSRWEGRGDDVHPAQEY